jgi:hypothetical protein
VAAPCAAKGPLRYRLTFTGRLSVTHSDQGLQSNGGGCNLGPDDTSPFADNYVLSLQWRTTFVVTVKRKRVLVDANTTRVSGGRYSYSGYAYDLYCNEIRYGPGGRPCTGTLASAGKGWLIARGVPWRKPRRLRVTSAPFGLLVATPAECTVASTPAVTYTAADELALDSLGATVTHAFRLRVARGARTYPFRLHRSTSCSQPAQSPGEIDTCTTTYSGRGSLRVRRR